MKFMKRLFLLQNLMSLNSELLFPTFRLNNYMDVNCTCVKIKVTNKEDT